MLHGKQESKSSSYQKRRALSSRLQMHELQEQSFKWIALAVLIGITISIETGTVENNRSSFVSKVQ